jgi:hypothetical protein
MKTRIDIRKILQKEQKAKSIQTGFDQALRGLGISKIPTKNNLTYQSPLRPEKISSYSFPVYQTCTKN